MFILNIGVGIISISLLRILGLQRLQTRDMSDSNLAPYDGKISVQSRHQPFWCAKITDLYHGLSFSVVCYVYNYLEVLWERDVCENFVCLAGPLYVLWTLSSWEHFDEASHAVLIIITALPPFCIRAFSKILWVQERCRHGCPLELTGVSGAALWFGSQSVGYVPNEMWKHMIAIPFSIGFQIWVRSKFQFGAFTFLTPFQPTLLFY